MKSTFVPLDIPSDVEELVKRDSRCSIVRVAPQPTSIHLSFGYGHSSRHADLVPFKAYASAYVDLAIEDLRGRKSDPRLSVHHRGFNTFVRLQTPLELFHTQFVTPRERGYVELFATAVANLYAAVARKQRIVDAVTARLAR